MKKLFLVLIKIYQLSNFIPYRICRFQPSCSEYTYQAIDKYGSVNGIFLGFKRLLKCHPFHGGGFDPVK